MKKRKNLNHPARGSTIKVKPIRKAEDIEAIRNLLADNPRNMALFTLGISTDLRVSELLKIKTDEIQQDELTGEIRLWVKRGMTNRAIVLDRACAEVIQHLIRAKRKNKKKDADPSEYLFSGRKGMLTAPAVNNLIKKWCAAVHLKGNYGSQTLRKTFGYQRIFHSNSSLPEIMVMFNHANPLQTLDYLCLRPEEIENISQTCATPARELGRDALIDKIKELEKTVTQLRESEEKFRTIFENVNDEIIYLDPQGTILEINDKCEDLFGLKREEVIGKKVFDFGYLNPHDMEKLADQYRNASERTKSYMGDIEIVRTDGASVFIETNSKFIESEGEIKGTLAIIRDITERKRMEKELQAYRDHLEELVKERTANLEEANAALRVMLRKENEVKEELEEKILININNIILPALEKVKKGADGKYFLDLMESNLRNMLSSFAHTLSSKYYNLTQTQLQIAQLIKQGHTTKEIAERMNLSSNTVHFHRANIRKKVGLSKQKINLRSFLLSFE